MQNTNVYKIQSYAVFSGFTNSIIISLCLIKSSNQMCDGRLDGRTDRHVHPSISTPLKATRVFYFFYFPRSLLWQGGRVAQWLRSLDLTTHTSLSPLRRGFAPGFINYKKGALDSQPHAIKFTSCLPIVGAWFSPGTPASSTTKTSRHDIAEILLKVALNTKNQIKWNPYCGEHECGFFSSFCVFEQV
jgi:hypothetical protein